ncbi:Dihydropteroate synthase [Rubellimicrobium mesophilum DSM 19309]|uniref:Dihydropteroate synthase n=1 Tax=Rubellimicrobium mesophilum DSM 19309 TaxID=442562 RepID=A0A017HVJ9_9RHOB|nr:dihydropteroate synthase [Rubellimicrobium mesophilum]EYD77784.1 Dihydropteroate synthase [Rubellimicrobium mesophilum DSM 19309]
MTYWRPIPMTDPARHPEALPLAGGWCWFDRVERLSRSEPPAIMPLPEVPPEVLDRLASPRAPIAGLSWERPRLMGILNVTPDSFSDGGLFDAPDSALAQARAMEAEGADLLDLGGESTRPGARQVPPEEEIARVVPVLGAIRRHSPITLSVDTRKAAVAEAALAAGAEIVNDVSALHFDPGMARVAARAPGLCIMHAQGSPETMQLDPRYDDVVLDVYDMLEERVAAAESQGIPRGRILVDPGIGFGKTLQHNVSLLRRLSLYHALGCAILLGASRKGFVGVLGGAREARDRMPGSVSVALHAARQGVQVLRVHDVGETRQALSLQESVSGTV